MKLQCQIDVVNRLHNSLNIRSSGKYSKSTLALGKEPKAAEYFIIHFSTANKVGSKYKVKNIGKVFTKCIGEGKATIRFNEPPHDLCIKCETIQLKSFLKLLHCCCVGNVKQEQLSTLSNISVTRENAPEKLVIHDRSCFPKNGLPRSLHSLYIKNIGLCNFRREILTLKHLRILDLSNNEIDKLPAELGRMPNLLELNLSHNRLGARDKMDWNWLLGPNITKTIRLLDISSNDLTHLPKAIWKLQNLITLKVDSNNFIEIPSSLGRISSLRYLTMSSNKLKVLPCSLMQCSLEYVDVSNNNFKRDSNSQQNPICWDYYVGNLVQIASKVVLKYKLYYAPNIIPFTLVESLDNANKCVCGRPVLSDKYYVIEYNMNNYFKTCVTSRSTVPFKCYFCSQSCYNIFLNPRCAGEDCDF